MNLLLQQLVNGLFIGSVYGLFAVGYTLVFGVLDILNLAHPAVFTLGGLTALWLVESAGLTIFQAFPIAVLVAGLLGLLLDRVAFAPLRHRADTYFSGLISSIAMAIMFESVALGVFGATPCASRQIPLRCISGDLPASRYPRLRCKSLPWRCCSW